MADRGAGAAPARAALAGNPSDGYGGAVLAVAVEAFRAEAVALPAVHRGSTAGAVAPLVGATVRRFDRELAPRLRDVEVRWSTTIPRTVGLGGSSAIVIATLRALCDLHELAVPPRDLAELALSIEVDDLGIAAGLQDRIAQSHGGLAFMDFASEPVAYEPLDPALLPPLLIAWRESAGEHSGIVHGGLRERFQRGDAAVRASMLTLAEAARGARAALLSGDLPAFGGCVDASFDARARMLELDPRHVEMVRLARAAGAAANYTGSGGAIVCACDDLRHRGVVAQALRDGACGTVEL